MQNVPWYMDLVGAGFTNHGGNAGGILIDTESGGHVELVNADRAHTTTAGDARRWYTVEEVYNTNRNPAELGIVHPLVYENEDSLVGQLGYSTGALLNSDQHAMVWCRNFDGGRSFTTNLGHNWQYATESWYQEMMLNAIQWTARPGVRQLRHLQRGRRSCWPQRSPTATSTAPATRCSSAALASAKAKFDARTTRARSPCSNQFVVAGQEAGELPVGQQLPGRRRRAREARGQGRGADRLGPRPEVAP